MFPFLRPLRQAIHKSHHALDRTCSDSVVTRRRSYRKSTSDLTEADSCETFAMKPPQQQPPSPRRRGSSKGGLAYLASRRERGSRDSIRSNASNASVFSNEDIGPLAFQASERGRQRRTSNFLELPGKVRCTPPMDQFAEVNIDTRMCRSDHKHFPSPAGAAEDWLEGMRCLPEIPLEH